MIVNLLNVFMFKKLYSVLIKFLILNQYLFVFLESNNL